MTVNLTPAELLQHLLDRPLPTDPLQRVEALAYDLAWGALNGLWRPPFLVSRQAHSQISRWTLGNPDPINEQYFRILMTDKWKGNPPAVEFLESSGFLEQLNPGFYKPTGMALQLLRTPQPQFGVFISYKRFESSALAVAFEARIKIASERRTRVYMDKDIPAGDWEKTLQWWLQESRFMLCLLGPSTLESAAVKSEIRWAYEIGSVLVPIGHNGIEFKDCEARILQLASEAIELPPDYKLPNAYFINKLKEDESAMDYEHLINRVLQGIGLSTY